MPDVDLGPLWGAAGAIATAVGVFLVKWLRAKGTEKRADHAAATLAWRELFEGAEKRIEIAETRRLKDSERIDGLADAVQCLNDRVAECQAKHEECERQHQECEQKHAALQRQVDSLSGTIRQVKAKVENGHGND